MTTTTTAHARHQPHSSLTGPDSLQPGLPGSATRLKRPLADPAVLLPASLRACYDKIVGTGRRIQIPTDTQLLSESFDLSQQF
jgi:hypothetical protein